jgi:hypothetical protein
MLLLLLLYGCFYAAAFKQEVMVVWFDKSLS